jgi:hypothetical protein
MERMISASASIGGIPAMAARFAVVIIQLWTPLPLCGQRRISSA